MRATRVVLLWKRRRPAASRNGEVPMRQNMRKGTVGLAILAVVLTAGGLAVALTAGTAGASKPQVVVATSRNPALQRMILVDRRGHTLYDLSVERHGRFLHDVDVPVAVWKPLIVAKGTRPAGARFLGTVKRPGGRLQVTYRGRPLYRFVEDLKPGDVKATASETSASGTRRSWPADRRRQGRVRPAEAATPAIEPTRAAALTAAAPKLSLRADERVEQCDAAGAADRHAVPPVPSVLNAQLVARRTEQPPNVVGHLAEEVACVVLAVHLVEDTTPIRVDQAAEELPGEALDDLRLPRGQFDLARMFPARAVLRNENR